MIDSISKGKLPKRYSYVLKSSELDTLLAENNITIHTDLSYYFSQVSNYVFCAEYWLPNKNVPYERLYLTSQAVPGVHAQIIKKEMSETILPKFIIWIQDVLNLHENSPLPNHVPLFDVCHENGRIEIIKSFR